MAGSDDRRPPPELDRALTSRALAWLAQREHSRQELRNKLLRQATVPNSVEPDASAADGEPTRSSAAHTGRRAAADRVDAVLDWLERHQHLSQRRFIEARLHARSARYGNARIRQELAQHGVELPADFSAALQVSEFERARAVWERKFASRLGRPAQDAADTAKQLRFLAGRGFSGDVIRRVLRETEPPAASAPQSDPAPADSGARNGAVQAARGASPRRAGASRLRLVSSTANDTEPD